MAPPSLERIEFFHLALLRALARRLTGRVWAVKGGICLRFFHRSPRLSQDMDLDVLAQVRVDTLRNAVDSILGGRSFRVSLIPQGIGGLEVTKPKQTETVQRWKVTLILQGGATLATKVEFSRRPERIPYSIGMPQEDLLHRYKLTPFAAQFYDGVSMAAQKIAALASPSRHVVRDLFDLDHLFSTSGVRAEEVASQVATSLIKQAIEEVTGFSVKAFKEEVVPFLSEEMIALYQKAEAFERLQERVRRHLNSMLR